MDEKTRAKYAALGISVRSGTQEEADSLGILIHFGNPLDKPKQNTPADPKEPLGWFDQLKAMPPNDDPKIFQNIMFGRNSTSPKMTKDELSQQPESTILRIYCLGSPAPGASWVIDVEFRQLPRGFSVWTFQDNLFEESSRWRKVGSSSKRLDWRSVCSYLINDQNLHVFGDLWADVAIRVPDWMPGWAVDLVKCSFIIDDDANLNYRAIMDLLSGFSDDEIQAIVAQLGRLIVPPNEKISENHKALEIFAKAAKELKFTGQTLSSILRSLGIKKGATLTDIMHNIDTFESEKHIEQLFSDSLVKTDRQILNDRWSKVIKGYYPDPSEMLKLVILWLEVSDKPSDYSQGDWAVLQWLMGTVDHMKVLFSALKKHTPEKAVEFAEEVMKRGKSFAHHFETRYRFPGGAMAGVGRRTMQTKVRIAIDCQTVLDQLGILFDPKYRIGDLPYFESAKR